MCRIRITTVQDLDLCAIITDRLHLFVSPFAKIKGSKETVELMCMFLRVSLQQERRVK